MSEFQQAVPAKSNGSAATETSAPTPGKQSLVDEVKPGAELFIDAKGKFLDVPIDGTPFKVEAEIGAEAKLKIEKAPKLDDPSSGRTKVTQSYGVEVEKKKDGPGIGISRSARSSTRSIRCSDSTSSVFTSRSRAPTASSSPSVSKQIANSVACR